MPEPSLRYVTVSLRGEMRDTRTEFIMGRNSRSEYRNCTGYCDGDPTLPGAMQYRYGPPRAIIQNHDLHYSFHLDLESGVYTAARLHDYEFLTRVKPKRKPKLVPRTGPIVYVHTETIDTGERRETFGRTARLVTIRTTRGDAPEINTRASDEVHGWYIDPPAAWAVLHPPRNGHCIFLAAVDGRIPRPEFTDSGPRETGFPLLLTRTHYSTITDAEGEIREHTWVDREEVTELSEDALDPDLFTPPRDFRRVTRLPGERPVPFTMKMRVLWQRWKNAFA